MVRTLLLLTGGDFTLLLQLLARGDRVMPLAVFVPPLPRELLKFKTIVVMDQYDHL